MQPNTCSQYSGKHYKRLFPAIQGLGFLRLSVYSITQHRDISLASFKLLLQNGIHAKFLHELALLLCLLALIDHNLFSTRTRLTSDPTDATNGL